MLDTEIGQLPPKEKPKLIISLLEIEGLAEGRAMRQRCIELKGQELPKLVSFYLLCRDVPFVFIQVSQSTILFESVPYRSGFLGGFGPQTQILHPACSHLQLINLSLG